MILISITLIKMNDKTPLTSLKEADSPIQSSCLSHEDNESGINSTALLGEKGMAVIIHHGQRYLLRQTKAGKLILTK